MSRYFLPGRALVIWLIALLSPTEWLLLLALDDRYHLVTGPPGNLVGVVDSLTVSIPLVALMACGYVVWRPSLTVGWIAFTILATLLQVAIWLDIIVALTGYAPAP